MADFKTKIKNSTCISEEYKAKLLANADAIPEEEQVRLLEILGKGEAQKEVLEKDHSAKAMGMIKDYLEKVKEFKRGPLKEARQQFEAADHASDEAKAEDLLNDL